VPERDAWEFPWAEVLDDTAESPDETYEAETPYFRRVSEASAGRPRRFPPDAGREGFTLPASFSAGPLSPDMGPPLLPLLVVVLVLISLAL
jgi:hypothetical protein